MATTAPMTTSATSRGVILDRDGIINVEVGYLHRIEDCVFVDGIFPLLRLFRSRGFQLAIATNQAGIGRGLFTEQDFHTLMDWMLARLAAEGAPIDATYHCPDHPTAGIGEYRRDSPCRKPRPGMMLQAIADLQLDPGRSWAIGDNERDMAAAQAAGIGNLVLVGAASGFSIRGDGVRLVPDLPALGVLFQAEAGGRFS